MTTLGKILGGGFPMAAYVGKEEIMKLMAPSGKVYQAGTYSGNPVSVTAGLATLKILREEGKEFYSKMETKREAITKPLAQLVQESMWKLQINQIASMFQLFFTDTAVTDYASAKTADNNKYMQFHSKLMRRGIFLPPSQFETCFISNSHSTEDLKKTSESFSEVLRQLELQERTNK
jgi:glutamate-1-semialdehyde 2,1-aminomutase